MPLAGDHLTQLSNVLPTGTFLAFQALASSATNNGDCGVARKVVISIGLLFLSIFCCITCFTDSYRAENGKLYYGLVDSKGLWSPFFKIANIAGVQQSRYIKLGDPYVWELSDFVNAGVSVTALATLTLLTPPVTTCFYPHIAGSIVGTVPLLVVLVVSTICAFTNSRHGIGFVLSAAAPAGLPTPRAGNPRMPFDIGGYIQGLGAAPVRNPQIAINVGGNGQGPGAPPNPNPQVGVNIGGYIQGLGAPPIANPPIVGNLGGYIQGL